MNSISPQSSAGYFKKGTETRDLIIQEQEKTIETLCETIFSASVQFEKKSEINKTLALALKRKCIAGSFDTSVVNAIENSFAENGRIFEETVVKTIADYSAQIREIADFHLYLINGVERSATQNPTYAEQMFTLILRNFKSCMRLSLQNSNTIVHSCTRYINHNHEFNTRLANVLSGQLHNKKDTCESSNTPNLSEIVEQWWQHNEIEHVT